MARRRDRGERPAGAGHRLAILHHPVGCVVAIEGGIGARAGIGKDQRRAANHGRSGARRQQARGGRMVAVGVGAQNGEHFFLADRGHQRIDVIGKVRPRIDHRAAFARAHDKALRAGIGVGRGVGGEDPAHQGFERHRFTGGPGFGGRASHVPAYADGDPACRVRRDLSSVLVERALCRHNALHGRKHPRPRCGHDVDARHPVCRRWRADPRGAARPDPALSAPRLGGTRCCRDLGQDAGLRARSHRR